MKLLIIRHAIAVSRNSADLPDDERPLTGRGRRRFQKAADGLARIVDRPEVLLTSPLRRAVQTAEIAAKAWGRIAPVEEPALAGSDLDAMLGAAMARAQEASDAEGATVALIGHEPSVSELVARLIGGARAEGLEFRKGGAALVELPARPEGGRLIWYLSPRVLRTLGEG